MRIAHLSDLHVWFSSRKLRSIEELVAAWQPDLLALTGDYADTPMGRRVVVNWMTRMAVRYPVCWVPGNHDYWGGPRFVEALGGVRAAHAIDQRDAWIRGKSGGRFRITSWPRMLAPNPTDGEAPTVVLLHDPVCIEPEKLRGVENRLLLAGHLHGGQITLWRDRHGRSQPAASVYRWLVDRATIGAATLIVSRGLGELLPIRVGAPREVVIVDFGCGSHAS